MSDLGTDTYNDTRRAVVNAFLTTGEMSYLLLKITHFLIENIDRLLQAMPKGKSAPYESEWSDVDHEVINNGGFIGTIKVPQGLPAARTACLPENTDDLNQIFEPYGVLVTQNADGVYEVAATSVEGAEALVDDMMQEDGLYQQARSVMIDLRVPEVDRPIDSLSLMRDLEGVGISIDREMIGLAGSTPPYPLYHVRVPSTEAADAVLTDMRQDGRLYQVVDSIRAATGGSPIRDRDDMSGFLGDYGISLEADGTVHVSSTDKTEGLLTDMLSAVSTAPTRGVAR